MGVSYNLSEFQNLCRLFPLPGMVLFPHAVLPLHIFEHRYRQMTEDALATDRFVTIVQPSVPQDDPVNDEPPVEPIACLGKILNCERLEDGRYNFVLLGLKRVRLIREMPSTRLYRQAEAELLEDEPLQGSEEPRRSELLQLFRSISELQNVLEPELASLLESGLSLSTLTDIVAHALGLPAPIKQAFLADCHVENRADGLIEILRHVVAKVLRSRREPGVFPPPFSVN
jgi:Lon protease-like protein